MIKDIPEYEGLYEIDFKGNVFSKNHTITIQNPNTKQPMTFLKKGKKLKPYLKNNGYLHVSLCKNGHCKLYSIHRLVATVFLNNPNNYTCVNHKDENKLNNSVENLEWCTNEYNYYYGIGCKKRKENQQTKKIKQFDLNNRFINSYNSINEAARILNIRSCNISAVCKGKRKTAGNYIWKYEEKENIG